MGSRCSPAARTDAAGVGGDLRPQVRQVLRRVACRPAPGGKRGAHRGFVELSRAHDADRLEQCTLFANVSAAGWHRAGRDAADVGMVGARGRVEMDVATGRVEYGRHDGHVRQVRPAVIGRVHEERVARTHVRAVPVAHGRDACAHRAEVDGHVRCVRHQVGLAVEDGAREVEALLDVHGTRGLAQHHAHLLGDVHEEAVEDLEPQGVDGEIVRGALPARRVIAREQKPAVGDDRRQPAGCDPCGGAPLDEQRGPGNHFVLHEIVASVQCDGLPRFAGPGLDGCGLPRGPARRTRHAPAGRGPRFRR